MNNGRDCPHGRQVGKCDTCDLITAELELEKVTAERCALAAQNEFLIGVLQSIGQSHLEDGESEAAESVLCHARVLPAECLRQVRADAVNKFVDWAADTQPNIDCMLDDSTDYIASILAGKE